MAKKCLCTTIGRGHKLLPMYTVAGPNNVISYKADKSLVQPNRAY